MARRALATMVVLGGAVAIAAALAIAFVPGRPADTAAAHAMLLPVMKDKGAAVRITACPDPKAPAQPTSQDKTPCPHSMKGSSADADPRMAITSAAQAVTLVSHGAQILSAVGRTGAAETTWGEYQTVSSTGRTQVSPTVDPLGTPVWVACASATVRPELAAPGTTSTYSWVCAAYEASTGTDLSETMGPTAWPAWFTRLVAETSGS